MLPFFALSLSLSLWRAKASVRKETDAPSGLNRCTSEIEYHTEPLWERSLNSQKREEWTRATERRTKMDAEDEEHRLIACITNKFSTALSSLLSALFSLSSPSPSRLSAPFAFAFNACLKLDCFISRLMIRAMRQVQRENRLTARHGEREREKKREEKKFLGAPVNFAASRDRVFCHSKDEQNNRQ